MAIAAVGYRGIKVRLIGDGIGIVLDRISLLVLRVG